MNIHFSASQSEFLFGFQSWHRYPFPNLNHWLKLKHSITVEEPTKIISFQFLILGFSGWSWLPRKLFLISLFKTFIAIIQIWCILPNIWTNDFFPSIALVISSFKPFRSPLWMSLELWNTQNADELPAKWLGLEILLRLIWSPGDPKEVCLTERVLLCQWDGEHFWRANEWHF